MSNFNAYMNTAWNATEVVGYGKVKQQNLGYGSQPDITLLVETRAGEELWLSAKELFKSNVVIK